MTSSALLAPPPYLTQINIANSEAPQATSSATQILITEQAKEDASTESEIHLQLESKDGPKTQREDKEHKNGEHTISSTAPLPFENDSKIANEIYGTIPKKQTEKVLLKKSSFCYMTIATIFTSIAAVMSSFGFISGTSGISSSLLTMGGLATSITGIGAAVIGGILLIYGIYKLFQVHKQAKQDQQNKGRHVVSIVASTIFASFTFAISTLAILFGNSAISITFLGSAATNIFFGFATTVGVLATCTGIGVAIIGIFFLSFSIYKLYKLTEKYKINSTIQNNHAHKELLSQFQELIKYTDEHSFRGKIDDLTKTKNGFINQEIKEINIGGKHLIGCSFLTYLFYVIKKLRQKKTQTEIIFKLTKFARIILNEPYYADPNHRTLHVKSTSEYIFETPFSIIDDQLVTDLYQCDDAAIINFEEKRKKVEEFYCSKYERENENELKKNTLLQMRLTTTSNDVESLHKRCRYFFKDFKEEFNSFNKIKELKEIITLMLRNLYNHRNENSEALCIQITAIKNQLDELHEFILVKKPIKTEEKRKKYKNIYKHIVDTLTMITNKKKESDLTKQAEINGARIALLQVTAEFKSDSHEPAIPASSETTPLLDHK